MAVTLYASTDASAPTLSGTAGSLITLLDSCLVTGYGSKSAAGWTKPYTGTNKAAFRNSATNGTGFYINVNDSGPGAGGAREARVTGFQTMTAVDTGTGQFPTSAQSTIGIGELVIRKSATADATARAWWLLADDTVFYLFVETGDAAGQTYAMMFGDIYKYGASDAYNCLLIARTVENSGDANEYLPTLATTTALTTTHAGAFMADSWTGVAGSLMIGKHSDLAKGGQTSCGGTSSITYPNGPDNSLLMAPIFVHHTGALRGYLKGLWNPLTARPVAHGDTFSGTGNMSGKTFLALYLSANNSELMLETSNTWS